MLFGFDKAEVSKSPFRESNLHDLRIEGLRTLKRNRSLPVFFRRRISALYLILYDTEKALILVYQFRK